MKLEFIPKVITLLAGAVVCIVSIVNDMDTTYSLAILLVTLIVFYIIGQIAKKIIQKVVEGNMFVKRNDGKKINVNINEEKKETADTGNEPIGDTREENSDNE